jgi:hypothetical protein
MTSLSKTAPRSAAMGGEKGPLRSKPSDRPEAALDAMANGAGEPEDLARELGDGRGERRIGDGFLKQRYQRTLGVLELKRDSEFAAHEFLEEAFANIVFRSGMIERAFHLGCAVDAPLGKPKVRDGLGGHGELIGRRILWRRLFVPVHAKLGLVVALMRGRKGHGVLHELEIIKCRGLRYLDA